MARRRSYTAKANRGKAGEVFINNLFVGSTKREIEAREAKERRRQREREREKEAREAKERRRQREREREAKSREREAKSREREAKSREREHKKLVLIANRVELELDKLGFFSGGDTALAIAKRAIEADVTAAKAKSYFIDGEESKIAASCADDLLESLAIPWRFHSLSEYKKLEVMVQAYRPQSEVTTTKKFVSAKLELNRQIRNVEEREELVRKREELVRKREELVGELLSNKRMFQDELEEFAEIIEKNDWSGTQSRESAEFKQRIKNKEAYVKDIRRQLMPFRIGRAND